MILTLYITIGIPKKVPITIINISANIFWNLRTVHGVLRILVRFALIRMTLPVADNIRAFYQARF